MAISILSGTPGTPGTDGGGTASVSFTIPSTIPDGSLIIAIHCNDFRDATNMVAPVLSGFSPTMNLLGTADGGLNLSHIKVWAFDYPAGASGTGRTLTCTETGSHDGDKGLSVYALSGAAAAASCLDGSLVATMSPSTSVGSFVLTGVTTSDPNSLLLAHIRTSNGAGTASITQPGSMTEQYDVANFTRFEGATEQLVASGATGTRTFTPASSVPYVAVMFAIKPASGGGAPVWLPTTPARRRIPSRPGRARVSTPVRAQVNPPFAFALFDQPRRLRGLLPRRARASTPVPAQVVVVPPAYPPQPERIRLRGLRLFRPRVAAPVPAQATPAPAVFVPQPDPRPRLRLRPVRGHAVTPPAAQASPPLFERLRLRVARAFRGKVRQPIPPQIVVIPPEKAAQALRSRHAQFAARRRRGGVEGWMVGGSHLCTITRPSTGITGHTVTLTPRPDTGTTSEPC